jgi:Major Facilitator Superfamily
MSKSGQSSISASFTMQTSSHQKILWRQVWGLAALLAASIFCWMAYGFYQPKILQNIGFVNLASTLDILQGIMGAIAEPCIGLVSDRIMQRVGNRLPLITVGITLAGLIFVAVSLLLEQSLPASILWFVPVLMMVWVMAMIVFRGPAIALLMQFAPTAELPKATSILVFVFGLVGAIGPLLGKLIQLLGASLTFLLGAIVLVVGGLLLRSTHPQHSIIPISDAQKLPSLSRCSLIFAVGLGAGLQVNLLLRHFPPIWQSHLPNIGTEYITASILLISAIAAIPVEPLTGKLGFNRAVLFSLAAIAGLMGLTIFANNSILVIILILAFGIAFGLLFIAQVPFALGTVSPSQAGLGTGLYFGGMSAASAIASIILPQFALNAAIGVLWGAIAFTIAALSLAKIRNQ